MLSVALIVFREVLEAALLIGVVFAATAGIAGRGRWILVGVGLGLGGAIAVAGCAEQLAGLAEGIGQELFNAGVLFTAVLMLAWHTLWMSTHGREMLSATRSLSHEIQRGVRPLYALAIVVGLAVLREGSEIVLFLGGMLAAGSTNSGGVMVGGSLGLMGGALLGGGISLGLLKIPTRHLFAVTGWWIALLAAGMFAQAIAFIAQAGLISQLTETAWDTSLLVSDGSIFGQTLHALIGYIAAPMVIQVVGYLAILLLFGFTIIYTERSARNIAAGPRVATVSAVVYAMAALFTSALSPPARAGFTVYSPYVEQGEWEFEFRADRAVDDDDAKDGAEGLLYELGYSPTARWHTAVFFKSEREPAENHELTEFAWENIFQLTEPGEYWLDLGAYIEYAKGLTRSDEHALEWKVLAEKSVSNWVFTANPIFVQHFSDQDDPGVAFEYAWGTHYRLRPEFEPGFEAFGDIGEITHANPLALQEHFIGPNVRGRFNLNGTSKIVYNIGYLFGLTDETPDGAVKFQLEYEWRF
jgi:FTR1 family protein